MREDYLSNPALVQYQKMLEENATRYFDVDDFCDIIGYYIDHLEVDAAEEALTLALSQHPESGDLRIKELELCLAKGRLSEAKDLIFNLYDKYLHDGDFLICVGRYYSIKMEHEKAISFYKKAIKVSADRNFILNALASEYLSLNKLNKALFFFQKALQEDREDEFAFHSIVQCFEELGRPKSCIQFLLDYIESAPYSEMAWNNLGLQYVALENYDKAVEAFDYAYLANPSSVNALFQKANCYEIISDFTKAIAVYNELDAWPEQKPYVCYRKGECYAQMDENSEALKYFTQATYLDPQLDKAWFALSLVHEKLNNLHEAKYAIGRCVELDSENVDYLRQSAYLNIELGYYEEATKAYASITRLEPNNFYAWFASSELLITIGDYKKAVNCLLEGIGFIPKNAKLFYQLSYCYFLLNDIEKGRDYLNQARKLNPRITAEMAKKYPHFEERNIKILQQSGNEP